MIKRIFSAVFATVGLSGLTACTSHFSIGGVEIAAPPGWHELRKDEERLTLVASDERQQATISVMRLGAAASFEEFKRLCDLRIRAEKQDMPDVFVEPSEPFDEAGAFGMFFTGGDKKSGRMFSGYLSLKNSELVTMYVEGIGVDSKDHLESFKNLVGGLRRQ